MLASGYCGDSQASHGETFPVWPYLSPSSSVQFLLHRLLISNRSSLQRILTFNRSSLQRTWYGCWSPMVWFDGCWSPMVWFDLLFVTKRRCIVLSGREILNYHCWSQWYGLIKCWSHCSIRKRNSQFLLLVTMV
jgi:hypothetical protein